MTKLVLSTLLMVFFASSASAECYADYKAKRDDPLRLHYGVIELPGDICSQGSAVQRYIERQLSNNDWELLNVLSVFGRDALDGKKADAGQFYLRY
ncbi:hypothetical protein [Aestuariivita sp.]|jgi:hypothetical protein|uniref:hypothetical protein n=1 Tax=Aestuariivita sp. TaxID=1872407 RepID=UPI002170F36B|nr:hypothetical protein [Aestuariivita sp.]MCE8006182.1 hypothetical protein [Aestuariivita sp.]